MQIICPIRPGTYSNYRSPVSVQLNYDQVSVGRSYSSEHEYEIASELIIRLNWFANISTLIYIQDD